MLRPQEMAKALKRMGIAQVDIPAVEVIFCCEGKDLVIEHPQVSRFNIMGQETYQVVGKAVERSKIPSLSAEDVSTVVEQTGTTEEKAREAIARHQGDLAAAILDLKK